MSISLDKVLSFVADFFLIYLLQSMSFVLGLYAINKQKVNMKQFSICTLAFLVATYIVRLLPINFGVHTLLSLIVLIILGVFFIKLPTYSTIKATLIITITLLIIEALNILIISKIFGSEGFNNIMENDLSSAIAGFPANVLLFIFIFILYRIFTRQEQRSYKDGEIS